MSVREKLGRHQLKRRRGSVTHAGKGNQIMTAGFLCKITRHDRSLLYICALQIQEHK